MTEQQFESLKVGDEVIIYSQRLTVTHIDKKELLISACPESMLIVADHQYKPIWYRYENAHVVSKDELREYLNSMCIQYDSNTAKEIRSIVRKEVIDSLKFPSYAEWRVYWNQNSSLESHGWFIEQVKTLNR
jgi:hypothetical protein